jgi:uncharacterized protein YaaQ
MSSAVCTVDDALIALFDSRKDDHIAIVKLATSVGHLSHANTRTLEVLHDSKPYTELLGSLEDVAATNCVLFGSAVREVHAEYRDAGFGE